MTNASFLPRKLIIFGIVLPLAAFLGYLLSSPDFESLMLVGVFACVLAMPLFLRWHHLILLLTWNLAMNLYVLPGNPPLWMIAAYISLGITLLSRILDKHKRLLGDASVTWSLLALALVVVFTMKMTAGVGLRSVGASVYGGRKYIFILSAIVAYFALSTQAIPQLKVRAYAGAWCLGGISPVFSHIIYAIGPGVWFLYGFFQADYAVAQALEDLYSIGGVKIGRLTGFGPAGLAIFCFLLMRFGLRGILDWRKPWRLCVVLAAVAVSLLGGFRSISVLFVAVAVVQFWLEGLHKTRLLPGLLVGGSLLLVAIAPFARQLPLPVQRCMTVLPFMDLDPMVSSDTRASTDWRVRMWEVVLPDIPKYLWVGKGCTANATDFFLANESMKRGLTKDFDVAMISGDYHSGPLSVIIPFGLPGVLAFIWFLIAAGRALVRNHRYGDPSYRNLNAFLLAYFLARLAFFLFLFGSLHSDLIIFVGLVGVSISVNRGVCKAPAVTAALSAARSPGPLILRPLRPLRPLRA